MKIFRVLLHGFVLFFTNFTGVFVGFVVYNFLKPINQIVIQLPVAALLSILLFLIWNWLLYIFSFKKMHLQNSSEFILAFICSLIWNPIIFVPLHYCTQGYVTDVGNVVALWIFQVPVNILAIMIAMKTTQKFGVYSII